MDNRITNFFKPSTKIKNFIPLPRFILREEFTPSAKLVYGLLVARTMLSQQAANVKKWTDKDGRISIMYTIEHLAHDSGLSIATVKNSLRSLKKAGLIITKTNGNNKPNTIYVKFINTVTEETYPPADQNEPPDSQNSVYPGSQNLATIYTDTDIQINKTEKEIGDNFKTSNPERVNALINGLANKFGYSGKR